jgi:8-oxo-dGTP pyrophosphatase MutT (NUDIX family)
VWLRRWVFRAGHAVLRVYWLLFRPRQRGVKCVIWRAHEVLLVRHTYGDRKRWELPGGAVKRGEDPRQAARRETREELGAEISEWNLLGELPVRELHRRDVLFCFSAPIGARDLRLDLGEIAEARWFPRDQLPPRLGRYVRRIVMLA